MSEFIKIEIERDMDDLEGILKVCQKLVIESEVKGYVTEYGSEGVPTITFYSDTKEVEGVNIFPANFSLLDNTSFIKNWFKSAKFPENSGHYFFKGFRISIEDSKGKLTVSLTPIWV